jgi:CDGSH-type Zn-finger protein
MCQGVIFYSSSKEKKMSDPKRASDTPYPLEVESGKSYFWCACGESKSQPFCDGSHKGTGFSPVNYKATESKKVFFCGCKASSSQPLCDGSHK